MRKARCYIIMVCDRNLAQATEQFSFIRTITVYPHQDDSNQVPESLESNHKNQNLIDSQQIEEVSALCPRKHQNRLSSLQTNAAVTISNSWYQPSIFSNDNSSFNPVIVIPDFTDHNLSKKRNFNSYLDKILLIIAIGYLCFVLWWLFGNRNNLFPLIFPNQVNTISQADADFITYMQQSLAVINTQTEIKTSSGKKNNSEQNNNAEVAFVPVYTPKSHSFSHKFDLPTTSNLLSPPPLPNQLAAMNPPVSAIPIKPPAAPSESVKNPTTSSVSNNNNLPLQTTSKSKNIAVIKPQIKYTLIGVMELQKGSAALFRTEGVTQKVFIGEKIANTDWVLDSVINQKVKVKQQNKTMTLNIGETIEQ